MCANLELLHQILPDRPHPRPLAVYIHRHRKGQRGQLDAANGEEDLFGSVRLEPFGEEEREDEAVEDVYLMLLRMSTYA